VGPIPEPWIIPWVIIYHWLQSRSHLPYRYIFIY